MKLYTIHGVLQVIAFLILYPLGFAMVLLQRYRMHAIIQVTASLIVLAAVVLAVLASSLGGKQEAPTPADREAANTRSAHRMLGGMVAFLIVLQLVWALGMHGRVSWSAWYPVHVTLALGVVLGGWLNLYLAYRFLRDKTNTA